VTGLSATEQLIETVRAQVTAARLDPRSNRDQVGRVASEAVEQYRREAALGAAVPLGNPTEVVARVVDAVCGYGALEKLLIAPGIEDIFIEGDRVTFLQYGKLRGMVEPTSEGENRHVIDQMLADTDVSLDRTHPMVDGVQVLDGRGRLSASIPPVSPELSANLRLYVERRATLPQLEAGDTLSAPAGNFLSLMVWQKGSFVLSGETGSGKSTLLAALLAAVRENHCVRLVEESRELEFRHPHGGTYQCVPVGPDGRGGITLRHLIRHNLRTRPDFIIVGETLGDESWDLARAARVGAGFMTTLHAPSSEEALEALVMTALNAGPNIHEESLRKTFARAVKVIVHMERDDPNQMTDEEIYRHQVTEVRTLRPQLEGSTFSTDLIFHRPGGLGTPLVWTGDMPATELVNRLERLLPEGTTLRDILTGRAGLP
jgi:pilus assembly protein CpaF